MIRNEYTGARMNGVNKGDRINDPADLSDFRPAYVSALKLWLILAGLAIVAIWVEASFTATLSQYLSVAIAFFAPGFFGVAAYIHFLPERAEQGAFAGFVVMSGYFLLGYVFAIISGPWEYSYLIFSNAIWTSAVYLYISLFLGRNSFAFGLATAAISTLLTAYCLYCFKEAPTTWRGDKHTAMQPYFYSIIAQWAMFFGARVINQLYKTMRESQRKIALLRSIMTDMVGHEIGTPLQAIFNNLELLQLFQGTIRTTAVDKTPIDKSFRVIESLRRSVQQVQSVLDNASITVNNKGKSTTGTPAIDDINLINLLEEIINDFSPRASERQLTIKLNLDHPTPAQVSLDKTRITQIVSNLLSNAIKYSDHGEITVSAASRWRDECQISVKDSGIGIPQEAIDDIFEPYFRLPEARNRGVKGSGLGLAVVKRELDVLDGRIKVTSKLGCGSEFKFFVPAKIHNFSLRTEPLLDQVTILVVDDSNIVLDAACQIFGMTKFRCITASDGGKAIDMLRTEPVDIVFLDIQMPVADGFIVAKTLRTDPDFSLNAHVPVIAMSTDEPSPTQGETNHFTHFMKKPFAFNGSLVSRFIMDARSGRSAQTANT